MASDEPEGLILSNLVIHLNFTEEAKAAAAADGEPVGDDEVDEEFFEVVVLPTGASGMPMITMSEETLTSLVEMIPGYRDYTIVPADSKD